MLLFPKRGVWGGNLSYTSVSSRCTDIDTVSTRERFFEIYSFNAYHLYFDVFNREQILKQQSILRSGFKTICSDHSQSCLFLPCFYNLPKTRRPSLVGFDLIIFF